MVILVTPDILNVNKTEKCLTIIIIIIYYFFCKIMLLLLSLCSSLQIHFKQQNILMIEQYNSGVEKNP